DDLDLQLHISSSPSPSTPQGSSSRPLIHPGFYIGHSESAPRECLNCKVKDLRINILEARLKMLETRLEMERHPEDHTCESTVMLHKVLNDIENVGLW
nr:hypothetical protein [Tanacetum cinerariifolium]